MEGHSGSVLALANDETRLFRLVMYRTVHYHY